MLRTQISMTEEQAERLRRLAVARRRSQAALLRDSLDELLTREERLSAIDDARCAIGAFSSGAGDTATHHDDVLDEGYRS